MSENTTRIVGTFQCPRGHQVETVQSPIKGIICQEDGCGMTAHRKATHLEPSPITSVARVRLALARGAEWLKGGGPADQQAGIIKELHEVLGEVFAIAEGVKLEGPPVEAPPTPADKLARLRAASWMVVCHNDYRQDGRRMTYWSFARGPQYIKGEGLTDDEALTACIDAARGLMGTPVR